MKYVIYLRVSTEQQAQSGLGLEAQRQMCLSYISKAGSPQSVLEYMDDGYCGALELDKRPALLESISQLEKGDVLLIAKRDRIGRDPIVNAMIERAVERKKARLISASGDVRDDNDPTSILMKRMVDAFAEYERLIIGARTKAALQVKKKKNECIGYVPYGYRRCIDNIHLEPDPEEQEILSQINQGREFGMSFREIAKDFAAMNIFNRKGNLWNHVSISRVMKTNAA
jgi:DNA invertase Pin-like site-specific DNA recombinase